MLPPQAPQASLKVQLRMGFTGFALCVRALQIVAHLCSFLDLQFLGVGSLVSCVHVGACKILQVLSITTTRLLCNV